MFGPWIIKHKRDVFWPAKRHPCQELHFYFREKKEFPNRLSALRTFARSQRSVVVCGPNFTQWTCFLPRKCPNLIDSMNCLPYLVQFCRYEFKYPVLWILHAGVYMYVHILYVRYCMTLKMNPLFWKLLSIFPLLYRKECTCAFVQEHSGSEAWLYGEVK